MNTLIWLSIVSLGEFLGLELIDAPVQFVCI